MKAKHLSPLGLICTIAWLATQPVAAQTQNPQAAKWFQAGLKASNAQTKVEAYNQALALDSTMIEAYYNLALVYKQQADFQQAQKYLERAHALPSDNTSLDLKNRIVYDLASLYRRQGKAKESEAILRQAKQEIKDTKMLSSVYFELGKLLLEQERFTEALAELRAGQQLDQGNKTFFTNLIQIAENSAAAQKQYAQARQAEARGSYLEAKAMYELIESLTPEYKDVQARRVRVDSVLNQDLQLQRALAAAYEQAQQYDAQAKPELAIPVYEGLLAQSSGDYKDTRVRLEQARLLLERRQRDEKIAAEYANGLSALAADNWTRAILAFEQVLALNPDHREARDKLVEAQNQLKREGNETIAARYYAEGVGAMEHQEWSAALAAFSKVSEINPSYRDVASRMKRIEGQRQQARAATAGPSVSSQVENLYAEAQAAIAKQEWLQAVIRLETVQVLQPNYRDVIDLLVESRVKLSLAAQPPAEEPGSNWLPITGIVIAAIVLPLLGVAAFSSTFRARYYLLRGNHIAAARIFERLLAKHPERAKLDATLVNTLSNYYLLSGRTDDRALEIYETAQQAALPSPRKEEMDTILKQHNRAAADQHEEALARLENRLKNHVFQSPSSNR